MIEMLPFKANSLLANRKSKIGILNLLLHTANDSIEAFSNFAKKNYFQFDAQVGEACCQIRAYKVCYLAYDNDFNESIKKTLTNIIEYKTFILKFIDNQRNKLSLPYNKLLDFKEPLQDFMAVNNLDFILNNDERFLLAAFFLHKYSIVDIKGRPTAINYQAIKNNFEISITAAKNLVAYYQSYLSGLSCKYVLDLLQYYTISDSNKILLKSMLRIGDEARYALPYYNEFKVLLYNTKTAKLPLLLIVNNALKDNEKPFYFLYKQDVLTGQFNLQTATKEYKKKDACLVFRASTNLDNTSAENIDNYLHEAFGYSIKDAFILNAAAHPQYTGEILDSINHKPYQTPEATSFYLINLVQKMTNELADAICKLLMLMILRGRIKKYC